MIKKKVEQTNTEILALIVELLKLL